MASFSLRALRRDELQHALVDQADGEAGAIDCENEWISEALHLLVDEGGEQARGELANMRLLDDEGGGRLDRELVELARGRAVVEAADGLHRDAHRIDVREPSQQRVTARTILLTSTGSWAPERFFTLMGTSAEGGGFRLNPGCCGAACAAPEFDKEVLVDVCGGMAIFLPTKSDRPTRSSGTTNGERRDSRRASFRRQPLLPPSNEEPTMDGATECGYAWARHDHPGRPSHESSETKLHPFRDADRGRSSDSRALDLFRPVPNACRFPTRRRIDSVLLAWFVPIHRCGAAPDSHRIPS